MAMNREQAVEAARERWRRRPVVECGVCGAVHRCVLRGERDRVARDDARREGEDEGGVKAGEGGER